MVLLLVVVVSVKLLFFGIIVTGSTADHDCLIFLSFSSDHKLKLLSPFEKESSQLKLSWEDAKWKIT